MAKKLIILAAMLAVMLVAAVPAMAQEGAAQEQYAPAEAEEFDGIGIVERADVGGGPEGYGLVTGNGDGYYLEGDFDFASLVGQEVSVSGTITYEGARVLNVETIEPTTPQSEEVAVTGVVFKDDDFSDGTLYNVRDEATGEVVPLAGGPGADFEPYLDQRATLYGAFIDEEPNGNVGRYLYVLRAELAGNAAGGQDETTTGGETTMGEETTAAVANEDGGTPEQAGIDLNEDGVVDEADGDFAVQTSDEGVTSTPDEGALPGTGGLLLPIAGLVGALLLAGGLLRLRNSAR